MSDQCEEMKPEDGVSAGLLAVLLGCLTILGPFSIDAVLPGFRLIGESLSVHPTHVQQVITAYLVPYALMSIVHGPLSDALGRRKIILFGLAVFAVASVGCGLARDLTTLLFFRGFQGLSAGVGLIVGRAVIRDVLAGADAQRLFIRIGMIFGIAPTIAPVVGGELLRWGWPATFWFVGAITLALLIATAFLLPETHNTEARTKLSVSGPWRTYRTMISERRFLLLSSATALNFAALWLYICSAPSFVIGALKLTELDFAWLFAPAIAGMVAGNFVSGRLAGRIKADRQIGAGFAICALAMVLNVCVSTVNGLMALPWAIVPLFINSFGNSLVFPVVTLSILDMYPAHRGAASSLQAFFSLSVNAIIAGVVAPVIAANTLAMAGVASLLVFGAWLCWRPLATICN